MAFADLQGRYGLSPATMAGLAQIAGQPTPDQAPANLPPGIDPSWLSSGPPQAAAPDVGPPLVIPPKSNLGLEAKAGSHVAPVGTKYDAAEARAAGDREGFKTAMSMLGTSGLNDVTSKVAGIDPNFKYEPPKAATSSAQAPTESSAGPGPSPYAASAGRQQVSPAHWQPGSHSVSMQRGMSPDELQEGLYNRDVAAGQGLLGADDRLESAQIRAKADAAYAADRIKAEDQLQTQMAAIKQRREAYVADQKKVLDQASAEASKKEDPQAFFKEAGTMGTIWAGLMVGLGQFSSAMTGTPNAALNIINGAIDRNIAAQRANIAGAQKKYDRLNSMYDKNLQLFGDDERAALATKVQYLDKVAAMADAEKAKAGPLDASAQNHALIQSIYSERAKAADEFSKLSHTQISEQSQEHFMPAQTYGGMGAPKREENLVTSTKGTTFVMPNKEVAGEAIKKVQILGQLQDMNNRILGLRQKAYEMNSVGDMTDYQKVMKQLRDLGDEKVNLLSSKDGQGVVKEAEYERAINTSAGTEEGVGFFHNIDPFGDTRKEATDAVLRAQSERFEQQQDNYLTSAGGMVYKRGYAYDRNGNLVPTGQFTGQDAKPEERLPPDGTRAMRSGVDIPTAGAPNADKIPYAPYMGPR